MVFVERSLAVPLVDPSLPWVCLGGAQKSKRAETEVLLLLMYHPPVSSPMLPYYLYSKSITGFEQIVFCYALHGTARLGLPVPRNPIGWEFELYSLEIVLWYYLSTSNILTIYYQRLN